MYETTKKHPQKAYLNHLDAGKDYSVEHHFRAYAGKDSLEGALSAENGKSLHSLNAYLSQVPRSSNALADQLLYLEQHEPGLGAKLAKAEIEHLGLVPKDKNLYRLFEKDPLAYLISMTEKQKSKTDAAPEEEISLQVAYEILETLRRDA